MKQFLVISLTMVMLFGLMGCTSPDASNPNDTEQTYITPIGSEHSLTEADIDIHSLERGDEVSIIGQKANSTLVNGNTILIQVQQDDGTFIIYHCQLKEDFLEDASEITLVSVVKVKGKFLSLMDLQQENTSPMVTLYDCEIVK